MQKQASKFLFVKTFISLLEISYLISPQFLKKIKTFTKGVFQLFFFSLWLNIFKGCNSYIGLEVKGSSELSIFFFFCCM